MDIKRIEELFCAVYGTSEFPSDIFNCSSSEIRRFGVLIVKECIIAIDNHDDNGGLSPAILAIKEHFGVES
jgi:hypothetical protein